jgi:hypothetical protein
MGAAQRFSCRGDLSDRFVALGLSPRLRASTSSFVFDDDAPDFAGCLVGSSLPVEAFEPPEFLVFDEFFMGWPSVL